MRRAIKMEKPITTSTIGRKIFLRESRRERKRLLKREWQSNSVF